MQQTREVEIKAGETTKVSFEMSKSALALEALKLVDRETVLIEKAKKSCCTPRYRDTTEGSNI